MKHIEHHEPDGGRPRCRAQKRRERRAKHILQVIPERLWTQHAQPDDGQYGKIDGGHGGACKHRAGHVTVRIHGLAYMAGSSLKRGGCETDQVEARHRAGKLAEPAGERHLQMESCCLMPVHMTGYQRKDARKKRQNSRPRGDRHCQSHRPFHAAQVYDGKKDDDADGERIDGDVRQIPGVQRGGRQDGRQAARRHPAPPVTGAGKIRQYGADRAERLCAARGNTAYPIGEHQDQLGPTECRRPTQHQSEDQ